MSGSKTGVATQIAREEERALYLHCFGHSLNLAVTDSVKKSKVCCDALETAMQVTKLIKFSPKRNAASIESRLKMNTVLFGVYSLFVQPDGQSVETLYSKYSRQFQCFNAAMEGVP